MDEYTYGAMFTIECEFNYALDIDEWMDMLADLVADYRVYEEQWQYA